MLSIKNVRPCGVGLAGINGEATYLNKKHFCCGYIISVVLAQLRIWI